MHRAPNKLKTPLAGSGCWADDSDPIRQRRAAAATQTRDPLGKNGYFVRELLTKIPFDPIRRDRQTFKRLAALAVGLPE